MKLETMDAPGAQVAPLLSLQQAPALTLTPRMAPQHSTSSSPMRGTPEACAFLWLIQAPPYFQTPAQLQPIPGLTPSFLCPQPQHSLVTSPTLGDGFKTRARPRLRGSTGRKGATLKAEPVGGWGMSRTLQTQERLSVESFL